MFAAEYGHLDVIEVLIERGADLETKDQVSCYTNYYNMLHCDALNYVALCDASHSFMIFCAIMGRIIFHHTHILHT